MPDLTKVSSPIAERNAVNVASVSQAPERPICSATEDRLDRDAFVRRIALALIDGATGRSRGVVVGVTGPWGSGKSSVLNLLVQHLASAYPGVVAVRFDPWLVSGRNDLVVQFMRELLAKIREEPATAKKLRKFAALVAKYGENLAPAADLLTHPGAGASIKGVLKAVNFLCAQDESLATLRKQLWNELAKANVPIVVLIDELDRVEDKEVRTVAQLVRSVADFPGVSYVLAYDHDRVVQALGSDAPEKERLARGQAYLEKIVQFPIALPIVFADEISKLLSAEMESLRQDVALPDDFRENERWKALQEILSTGVIDTPRDVKRLVGSFHVLAGMLVHEVDWVDLLAFSALSVKAPETTERIRREPGLACEEDLTLATAKKSAEERWDAIFKGSEDEAAKRLVDFLFPHLRTESRGQRLYDRPVKNPDALRRRRPLLMALRLGLLPGGISRAELIAAMGGQPDQVARFFRGAYQGEEDNLGKLIDRLAEIYGSGLGIDHVNFWKGVAEFLRKQDREWMASFQPMHNVIQNLAGIMLKAVERDEAFAQTALTVFTNLRNGGDTVLTVSWLRAHVFMHGLFGRDRRSDREAFLTPEQTKACARDLCKDLRLKQLGGELIPGHWDLQPVYMMLDAGEWDAPCRQKLDQALADDVALDGFTLMLYGDGYTTDKDTVAGMCSYDAYVERVRNRLASDTITEAHQDVRVALKKANEGKW